jgi:hypothetical protein
MDAWKNKRKEWTTARDKHGVKKGAVSGVSIGDALDKVYASSAKGYKPLLAAIAALRKDLAKYIDKSGKASPSFVTWIKGNLIKDLDRLEQDAQADLATLTKMYPYLLEFHQVYVPGMPDSSGIPAVLKAMEKDKLSWQEAARKMGFFQAIPKIIPKWVEVSKYYASLSFKLRLPGKDASYKFFDGRDKMHARGAVFLSDASKTKDFNEYAQFMKAMPGEVGVVDSSALGFKALVEGLVG